MIEFWLWVYLRWIPVDELSTLGLACLWLGRGLALAGLIRVGWTLRGARRGREGRARAGDSGMAMVLRGGRPGDPA